jgi:hypothetical protein
MIIEFLTFALVLITAFYAWATFQMLGVMSEQSEALNRPYVSISPFLEPDNPIFSLRISNIGKTGASNLRLNIDRSFYKFGEVSESNDISKFNAFTQPIDSFPPGAEIIFALAQGFVIFGKDADATKVPQTFTITATYSFGKRTVIEVNNIDLRPYLHADVPQDATIRKLAEMNKHLKQITTTLAKP